LADGLAALLGDPDWVFLEVGPGGTLSSLTRQQVSGVNPVAVTTLGSGRDTQQDTSSVLDALGRLWLNGVPVSWPAFSAGELRNRIPLPTYPFERQRYWVGPPDKPIAHGAAASARRPPGDWFYVPSWVDATLVEQRILEAGALLPGDGGVTGWAALRWLGGTWFTGTRADGRVADIVYRLHLRPDQLDVATMHGRMQIDEFSAEYAWRDGILTFLDAEKQARYEVRPGARVAGGR